MLGRVGNGFRWFWTPSIWPWNPAEGPWRPEHGSPKTSVYLEVSCRSMKPRHAYEYWRETAFYTFEPDPRPPVGTTAFQAAAKGIITPRGNLFAFTSEPISGRRTRRQAASGYGGVEIGLVLSGVRFADSDHIKRLEGSVVSTPGQFFVYDPTHPTRVHWEAHRGIHVTLPRQLVVDATGGEPPSPGAMTDMINHSRLAPFLRSQLRLLARDLSKLSPLERSLLVDNTIDLLLTILRTSSHDDESHGDEQRQGLFVAAQRYIEEHLGDPQLSAEQIAHAIGCSRSTLYRAFAEHRLTVADCIRERRFQLFFHLLQEAPKHVTVSALAHRCGFGDSSHISKAFKERFGLTPNDVRRAAPLGRPDASASARNSSSM